MERIFFKDQNLIVNKNGGGIAQYYLTKGKRKIHLVNGYERQSEMDGCMGDILSPFPGRVDNGEYKFLGKRYKLIGFKLYEGETPLHIFVRENKWKVIKRVNHLIKLEYGFSQQKYYKQGYPFALQYQIEYSLSAKGLKVKIRVKNTGKITAPFGIGFHPYLKIVPKINQTYWQVPARKLIEYGSNLRPTGRIIDVKKADLDFCERKLIKNKIIDNCFTDLIRDKKSIFTSTISNFNNSNWISIWQDENYPYFQAYSSDTIKRKNQRKSLALEPHSSCPFSINMPKLGLITLKPSQIFRGTWGISHNFE